MVKSDGFDGKPLGEGRVAALAFSGGLDTSFCALWLAEQGWQVHAVTVDTGGLDDAGRAAIAERAAGLGVAHYACLDAREELFDDFLRYLIYANATRGDHYPLCVSVERVAQARRCAKYALEARAAALAHGSTGAGNDQVRFDTAFSILAPKLALITPIRSLGLTREQVTAWLMKRGVAIPASTSRYSVNRGLWGATIGGAETHYSDQPLPEKAYVLTALRSAWPREPETVTLRFDKGVPVALEGRESKPVMLIEALERRAALHGVGRGMHVGDTILGLKGRVAFEAPAAAVILSAHRELEKLVLSRAQQTWKRTLGDLYGGMMHEGRAFDPIMRDIEAFLTSSQRRVSGEVVVELFQGQARVLGVSSPFSLLGAAELRYGESSALWSGEEAAAFCRLYGLQDRLMAGRDAAIRAETGGRGDEGLA